MASPENQHCASCIGTLSFPIHVPCSQWCIAKNGGGYTQRGVAKGLKVPCLFMITEVRYAVKKIPEVGIRRIPAYTPPQYTTACSGWPVHMLTELWTGSGLNISEIRTRHPPESARMAVTRLRALSAVASCSPVLTTARSRSWPEAAEVTPPLGPPRSLCYLLARPPASSSSRLRCSYYNRNPDDFRCQRVSPRQLLCVAMISIWPRIGLSASTIYTDNKQQNKQGTKVCRYSWHSAGSPCRPFPMLNI